jgi:hypothetical protein
MQVEHTLNSQLSETIAKLLSSESQKSELEFLYEETSAKLSELTLKLDEKTKEVVDLCQNQTERQIDIELAFGEQKIFVQELETKLNAKCDDFKLKVTQFDQLKLEFGSFRKESSTKVRELVEEQRSRLSQVESLESDLNELKESKERVEKENVAKCNEYEKQIEEFNLKLNSTRLTQSDQVSQLESEIKLLKEANDKSGLEKATLESSKNSQIVELVRKN